MRVALLEGQTLGQYQLREPLGQGGMGTVYRGYQANLKREVAVKVLPDDLADESGYIERFNREAEIAAALEHPNIVPILDYGTQRGISYVVMRLLTGGTLSQRIRQQLKQGGHLPSLGEISRLLSQLASALDYAHSKNVIHRDIKPNNVMFDNHGHPYLVDFGIAKLLEGATQLTGTGMTMGTPAYMPPEQWRGEKITPAADQYALGAMIYELVTGRVPFVADTPFALMHKHINEQPTPPQAWRADSPDAVNVVLERAMAKDAADRFASVTAFAQAFDRAIQGTVGSDTNFFTAKLAAQETRPRNTKPTLLPDVETALTPSKLDTPEKPRHFQSIAIGILLVLVLGLIGYEVYGRIAESGESERVAEENATLETIVALTSTLTANPAPTEATPRVVSAANTELPALTQVPNSTVFPTGGGDTQLAPAPTEAAEAPTEETTTTAFRATEDIAIQPSAEISETVIVLMNQPPSSTPDRRFYDRFDEGASPNPNYWNQLVTDNACSFSQASSLLEIRAAEGSSEKCVLEVNNSPYTDVRLFGSVTARFQITDSAEGHQSAQGIVLLSATTNNWGIYCGLDTRDAMGSLTHHFFRFDATPEEGEYADSTAEFDKWYTYRLVYYPTIQTFECFVNETLSLGQIGVGNLALFETITNFSIQIEHLRQFPNQHSLSYVDDVVVEPSYIYDNFNLSSDDGGWDGHRWELFFGTERKCEFIQDTGLMKVKLSKNERCIWGINNPVVVAKDALSLVGAEIYLTSDPENDIYPAHTLITVLGDDRGAGWSITCGSRIQDGQAVAEFVINGISGAETSFEPVAISFNEWNIYKLIFDSSTYNFTCLMNGIDLGTASPRNTSYANFSIGVESILVRGRVFGYGYVDNFRLLQLEFVDPTPMPSPTDSATATSTRTPTRTRTPEPARTSTPTPSETTPPISIPTDKPTNTPTEKPTEKPTELPTATPTPKPTELPSKTPTPSDTVVPSKTPTPSPTPL